LRLSRAALVEGPAARAWRNGGSFYNRRSHGSAFWHPGAFSVSLPTCYTVDMWLFRIVHLLVEGSLETFVTAMAAVSTLYLQ
jgi:hypothetical protein